MSAPRVWQMSTDEGMLYVECPAVLSADDVTEAMEFLDIVRRQISRGGVAVKAGGATTEPS